MGVAHVSLFCLDVLSANMFYIPDRQILETFNIKFENSLNDMKAVDLKREDTQDRVRWTRGIKVGTGQPG